MRTMFGRCVAGRASPQARDVTVIKYPQRNALTKSLDRDENVSMSHRPACFFLSVSRFRRPVVDPNCECAIALLDGTSALCGCLLHFCELSRNRDCVTHLPMQLSLVDLHIIYSHLLGKRGVGVGWSREFAAHSDVENEVKRLVKRRRKIATG